MQPNIGNTDRTLRVLLGIAAVWWDQSSHLPVGTLRLALYVFAAWMLFTAVLGICPVYRAIGFSSVPLKRRNRVSLSETDEYA